MKLPLLLVGLIYLSPLAAQQQNESPNNGVLYGAVVDQNGKPAKGLTLNALPLGVMLLMPLPWTRTNDAGAYRFEHLPLGRYTVYAEDKEAGYSVTSTGAGGAEPPPEVRLTAEHPEAEFNIHLPPPAGFLLFHLTNRSTAAPISSVEVTFQSVDGPPSGLVSTGTSATQPVLVPSGKDLVLHVTSQGFQEWDQSVGAGKRIRIEPGDRLTLDVPLQPSNPLTQRIPDADENKYRGIHDAKVWLNPILTVRADGIEVAGAGQASKPLALDDVTQALAGLPDSAWPYGRILAVQPNTASGSESDQALITAKRDLLLGRLNELGVLNYFF